MPKCSEGAEREKFRRPFSRPKDRIAFGRIVLASKKKPT